ncbi:hypothetical protein [Streptomyces europaeiscabiei]|uniref:hypothetical protein n=1 Tax=Streptomyces europaeiscabiei TaxID=146819 RepID=UPI002E11719C|nr:hypothetical protein OHB30_08185 [Streptomyces europaeiscabiei]
MAALGFWLMVAVGAADSDTFDRDANLDAWGMGGVPVAVALSLWTGFAWSGSLGLTVLLDPVAFSGPTRALTGLTAFVAAALASWRVTRVLVRLLRRLHPDEPGPSSPDFVGLTCTVRSERADDGFGRAEVVARDGSTAVVKVRRRGTDDLACEGAELLCAYDETNGFFWVARGEVELHPHGRAA